MSETLLNRVGEISFIAFTPILLAIGFIGNPLSYLVYSRSFFSKTSTGLYLRALCITDTIAVSQSFFIFLLNAFNIKTYDGYVPFCKIYYYTVYYSVASSAWIESMILVDRLLSITYPTKFKTLARPGIQLAIVWLIVIYNLVSYSPMIIFYNLYPDGEIGDDNATTPNQIQDTFNLTINFDYLDSASLRNKTNNESDSNQIEYVCQGSEEFRVALSFFDMFNSTILPFLIMTFSSCLIIRNLYKSRNSVAAPRRPTRNSSQSMAIIENTSVTLGGSLSTTPSVKVKVTRREQRDFQFSVTSISLCLIFFFLNIPTIIYDNLSSRDLIPEEYSGFLLAVTNILFYADYSIKFLLYIGINKRFYTEFIALIKK